MTDVALPASETHPERLIKQTTSLCPRCLEPVPARVVAYDGAVWMHKHCERHGEFSVEIDSDARHYLHAPKDDTGQGGSCCGSACGAPAPVPGGEDAPAWTQHSCTVLIEIIERCNLTCPTCFAGSSPQHSGLMSMADFRDQVDRLAERGKSSADMIQLSGGEPTLHPRLFDMIDYLLDTGFAHVVINSNGIKLAQEDFADRLATVAQRHRTDDTARVLIYLQFDGFDEQTHERLRGRSDLLRIKRRAMTLCEARDLPVYPVMTLTRGINDHEVGDFIALAETQPRLRNLVIQPVMYSGRYDNPARSDRITLGDTIALVREQFPAFRDRDFIPIPCSDPNCYRMAAALRTRAGLLPITRYFPDFAQWDEPGARDLVDRFADTIDGTEALGAATDWALAGEGFGHMLADLSDAQVEELLDLVSAAAAGKTRFWDHVVTLSIKPFMDAWSYDQDRIDQCCVHILDADGHPVSFCEYNAVNRPRMAAARGLDAPARGPLGVQVLT